MGAFFWALLGAVVGCMVTLNYDEISDWLCARFPQIFYDEEDDEDWDN